MTGKELQASSRIVSQGFKSLFPRNYCVFWIYLVFTPNLIFGSFLRSMSSDGPLDGMGMNGLGKPGKGQTPF